MPNIALVPVEGDLDVTTAPRVRATVDSLIASGCRRVILNMAGVQYVDSAGMALLFREIRSMRQAGGLLSL
ncbi:STAS domain-containing protein, partial [Parafannyhessea umbonata]